MRRLEGMVRFLLILGLVLVAVGGAFAAAMRGRRPALVARVAF